MRFAAVKLSDVALTVPRLGENSVTEGRFLIWPGVSPIP
jgi:hypothetical protein